MAKIPGVFIEEVPSTPPAVTPVATAVPAFVGYTEKAEKQGETLLMKPTRISSLVEYKQYFGRRKIPASVDVVVDPSRNFAVTEVRLAPTERYFLYDSLRLFFDNGGGPCYVVSVGLYGTGSAPAPPAAGSMSGQTGLRGGLHALETLEGPTLLLFPDACLMTTRGDDPEFYALQQLALQQCARRQDRFAIFDLKENLTPVLADVQANQQAAVRNFRQQPGTEHLKFGAAYTPWLYTAFPPPVSLDLFRNTLYSSASGKTLSLQEITGTAAPGEAHPVVSSILSAIRKELSKVPPSGAIAGVYARIDATKGVWSAPANANLVSVQGPVVPIGQREQETLNVDIQTGKSINAIRTFTGKGTLVWGARTLAGNDNDWRYVSVRRFFIMVEESCRKAMEAFALEPNDPKTWVTVRAMLENFFTTLWRQGALQGTKPDNAFYVAVGLGKTMTALDIQEGRMVIELGLAVVRPAEFIIIQYVLKMRAL